MYRRKIVRTAAASLLSLVPLAYTSALPAPDEHATSPQRRLL